MFGRAKSITQFKLNITMATSFFQINNFPNLDNPKFESGGLFDNPKTNQ